jgi:hypothetical protein
MTPSKLAFLILEAKSLEDLQSKVRTELISERLLQPQVPQEMQRSTVKNPHNQDLN